MNAMTILAVVAAAPFAFFAMLVAGVMGAYARRAFYGLHGASLGLIVREAWAQLVVIGWTLARRGSRADDAAAAGGPVVFVHGFAADGSSMWGYRRAVMALGRRTTSPHLGGMFRPIPQYATRLIRHLERVLAETPEGEGVDVVCHSMGGVVLRAALGVRPDLGERIHHVVTVATPHTGTAAARHLPVVEARQLLVNAPFLADLQSLPKLLPHARFTTISSTHDAVVYPDETCGVVGAEHHSLSNIGHAELLTHPRAVDLVVASLR